MTVERCKAIAPIWSNTQDDRIPLPESKPSTRFLLKNWLQDFKKRNGIALILILAWAVSMIAACLITGAIVKHNTSEAVTEELTHYWRGQMQEKQDYITVLESIIQKRNAEIVLTDEEQTVFREITGEGILTGEKSREAAVDNLAEQMAYVISTYSQDYGVTQEGLYTIGWVFCARDAQHSSEFGKTPQEILEKPLAWEGKVVGHATRSQDRELAREIARDYLDGNYPDNYTTALTFFNREPGGKIIARNELQTSPYTIYWWFGK